MTRKQLASDIRSKLDGRDTVNCWRHGIVYRWSPVFNKFSECHESATIKPNESLLAIEAKLNGFVAIIDL